jgi:hypothetical protein
MPARQFTDTLVALRYGKTHDDLTEALNALTAKVMETNKAGSITLKLKLTPTKSGQVEIDDTVTTTMPVEPRSSTLFFATLENNLQREDPRQDSLPGIRQVPDSVNPIRQVN